MDIGLSLEILTLLFCSAIIAGCIDTLAGGGGLITLPALMLSGAPPIVALATNKLQGSIGTATASLMVYRQGLLAFSDIKKPLITAFIGAGIGAIAVQFIDMSALSIIIPIVLIGIAIYFICTPFISLKTSRYKLPTAIYHRLIVPFIGIYDGMFGPGTGSFFAASGTLVQGLTLIAATAQAKPLNFATNVASLLVFLFTGHIAWTAGCVMIGGQIIGAWLGSKLLFRIPAGALRVVIISLCLIMLAKYFLALG